MKVFFYKFKFYRIEFRVNTAKAVNKWSSVHIVQYIQYTLVKIYFTLPVCRDRSDVGALSLSCSRKILQIMIIITIIIIIRKFLY